LPGFASTVLTQIAQKARRRARGFGGLAARHRTKAPGGEGAAKRPVSAGKSSLDHNHGRAFRSAQAFGAGKIWL
jgi:hypothetical protein